MISRSLVLLSSVAASFALTRTAERPPLRGPIAADSTIVVLLGTGYATPLPDQQGPATAVVVGDRVFLFDAGPGDSAGVKVTAFKVPHGTWDWAFGYRIDTPTRSVVISGDTRPSDELVTEAQGVDVLVHEVYPESNGGRQRGDTTTDYFRAFHTSDVELGRLAARAQPKLLLLTHIVRRRATDDELIAGIRSGGFTGKVVVGKDLGRY